MTQWAGWGDKEPRKKKSGANPHTELLKAILQHARLDSSIKLWKNNVGAVMIGERFVQFGEAGQADIVGLWHTGQFIAFECKTGTAIQSSQQKQWEKEIKKMGGEYVVIRSIHEFIQWRIAKGKKG